MDQPMELVIKVLGDKLELDVILGLDIDVILELVDKLGLDVILGLDIDVILELADNLKKDFILELVDKLELERKYRFCMEFQYSVLDSFH